MKNNLSIKLVLSSSLTILFIFSAMTPATPANTVRTSSKEMTTVDDYDCYHHSEISNKGQYYVQREYSGYDNIKLEVVNNQGGSSQRLDVPMGFPWPLYCHDTRHTGRSPYSTVNTWDKIWRFSALGQVNGGSVVADDGTIYTGAQYLYAIYSNGTKKWSYDVSGWIESSPAIDENGMLYVGTVWAGEKYLYSIYPNGTLKWNYPTSNIYSSPTIGSDGMIYFGDSDNWNIIALYPNGTLKWAYHTDMVVYSSPAIGDDGTVYCGSHDTYLYALYPNNGTLKWKYKTGDWIRTSPCIADDGTIYCVSLDGYLYAINPDGSLKWKTEVGAGTSPTIGQDGTIYCGYTKLHAVDPTDGSVKWTFDVGGTIQGGTPCNSIDGTIYVGTSDGGELIAVNPDGTLKWRKSIGTCESAPAIGKDGTVYVGSNDGYLYAFGIGPLQAEANGPYYGLINQPVQFKGSSGGGYLPYSYHWNFGDTHISNEQNPTHVYTSARNYTVTLTITDSTGNTSSDTSWAWIQTTNTPPNKPTINGPTQGEYGISYDYKFKTTDPDGTDILWYYVDWGDGSNTGWIGPYSSNEEVTQNHFWYQVGTYTIKCKAKDPYNAESDWGTLQIKMPRNRIANNMLLLRFLERFPLLEKLFLKFRFLS